MSTVADTAHEQIPDEDKVSRAYFALPPGIDPASGFVFPYDKKIKDRAESVYWRKYAINSQDVHDRACKIEKTKNARLASASRSLLQYTGFRTADVRAIRGVRSGRGHQLDVVHWPEDGDLAHAHICIKPGGSLSLKKLKTNDVQELVDLLHWLFVDFTSHRCF